MPFVSDPTAAERIYSRLIPLHPGDEENCYPLYALCEAATLPQDPLEEIVYEDDTHPAWTRAVDPYEAPLWVLPWLALLVGVQWKGASSEALRDKIIQQPNYRRGTVPAIKAAARVTLTGTKTVGVGVALGDPWHMTVGTYASETPNPTWTMAQILTEKPAGVILESLVDLADWTYFAVWVGYEDYDELNAAFATYADLFAGP